MTLNIVSFYRGVCIDWIGSSLYILNPIYYMCRNQPNSTYKPQVGLGWVYELCLYIFMHPKKKVFMNY